MARTTANRPSHFVSQKNGRHFPFTEHGLSARLITGWTLLAMAVALVAFNYALGLSLFLISTIILSATYYAVARNKTANDFPKLTKSQPSISRKSQAFEFRELFEAGIISKSEYENGVANLYPEINRPTTSDVH